MHGERLASESDNQISDLAFVVAALRLKLFLVEEKLACASC